MQFDKTTVEFINSNSFGMVDKLAAKDFRLFRTTFSYITLYISGTASSSEILIISHQSKSQKLQ